MASRSSPGSLSRTISSHALSCLYCRSDQRRMDLSRLHGPVIAPRQHVRNRDYLWQSVLVRNRASTSCDRTYSQGKICATSSLYRIVSARIHNNLWSVCMFPVPTNPKSCEYRSDPHVLQFYRISRHFLCSNV